MRTLKMKLDLILIVLKKKKACFLRKQYRLTGCKNSFICEDLFLELKCSKRKMN